MTSNLDKKDRMTERYTSTKSSYQASWLTLWGIFENQKKNLLFDQWQMS